MTVPDTDLVPAAKALLSRLAEDADFDTLRRPLTTAQFRARLLEVQAQAAERAVHALAQLIVSYADLTHDVVQRGGDWREIADEWGKVVDEARTLLGDTDG